MQNLEGQAISKERSSTGRSFHPDGPTTEKALRCIVSKWARGTKSSPLAAQRSTRRVHVCVCLGVIRLYNESNDASIGLSKMMRTV